MFEIEWLSGPSTGEKVGLQVGENVVGRSRRAEIALRDRSLSMFHCRIYLDEDGTVEIEDAKSLNGTFVNGHRVGERVRAPIGCEITVGAARFRLQRGTAPAAQSRRERRGRRLSYRERRQRQEEVHPDEGNDRTQMLRKEDLEERKRSTGVRRRRSSARRSVYREAPKLDDDDESSSGTGARSEDLDTRVRDLEEQVRSQGVLNEHLKQENVALRERIAQLELEASQSPALPPSPFEAPASETAADESADEIKGFWNSVTVEEGDDSLPGDDLSSQVAHLDAELLTHSHAIEALETEIEILTEEIDTLEEELEESEVRYVELEAAIEQRVEEELNRRRGSPVAEQQRQLIDELIDDLGG